MYKKLFSLPPEKLTLTSERIKGADIQVKGRQQEVVLIDVSSLTSEQKDMLRSIQSESPSMFIGVDERGRIKCPLSAHFGQQYSVDLGKVLEQSQSLLDEYTTMRLCLNNLKEELPSESAWIEQQLEIANARINALTNEQAHIKAYNKLVHDITKNPLHTRDIPDNGHVLIDVISLNKFASGRSDAPTLCRDISSGNIGTQYMLRVERESAPTTWEGVPKDYTPVARTSRMASSNNAPSPSPIEFTPKNGGDIMYLAQHKMGPKDVELPAENRELLALSTPLNDSDQEFLNSFLKEHPLATGFIEKPYEDAKQEAAKRRVLETAATKIDRSTLSLLADDPKFVAYMRTYPKSVLGLYVAANKETRVLRGLASTRDTLEFLSIQRTRVIEVHQEFAHHPSLRFKYLQIPSERVDRSPELKSAIENAMKSSEEGRPAYEPERIFSEDSTYRIATSTLHAPKNVKAITPLGQALINANLLEITYPT